MHILLTGASGGIGSAIKDSLQSLGHMVVSVSHQDVDLANPDAIRAFAENIKNEGKPIDWVVYAHGFIDTETVLEDMSAPNIENTFRVNILSVIYLAQQLLPLIPDGGGMIALSSAAGVSANGRFAPYSASKAAVNSFMQALARNRPEKKFFAVAPGPTNTGMRNRVSGDAANQQNPEVVAELVATLIAGGETYNTGDVILVKSGEISVVSKI